MTNSMGISLVVEWRGSKEASVTETATPETCRRGHKEGLAEDSQGGERRGGGRGESDQKNERSGQCPTNRAHQCKVGNRRHVGDRESQLPQVIDAAGREVLARGASRGAFTGSTESRNAGRDGGERSEVG